VWDLYLSSTSYNSRPSHLLNIEDPYKAFCLDQAVRCFGRTLEARLDEAGADAKNQEQAKRARQRILDQVLTPGEVPKKRFADPAAKFA